MGVVVLFYAIVMLMIVN